MRLRMCYRPGHFQARRPGFFDAPFLLEPVKVLAALCARRSSSAEKRRMSLMLPRIPAAERLQRYAAASVITYRDGIT